MTDKRHDLITHDAEALQQALRQHPHDSTRQLLEFAERYAVAPHLLDAATLLQMEYRSKAAVDDALDADRDDLVERMIHLVDAIVDEQVQEGRHRALEDRDRVMVELREHFARVAPPVETFFEASRVTKRHGAEFELGRLDLALRLGEITGVVGQNGHGKTTLLRLVAGELMADEGTVRYPMLRQEGHRIDWRRVKEHIAFVPQELPGWRGDLEDTLRFEAALHGLRGEDNHRAVRFIVERLGLGNHLEKRWSQLSGGYKLRFALARALVWRPRLLVMDEPLANLDIKAKGLLLQDVRDLAKSYGNPIAVIMSSHDLHNLEAVCNQMIFLQDGKVRFVGTARDLGEGREWNEFEVGTTHAIGLVQERLSDVAGLDVRQDGLNLVVRTPLEMSPSTVLALLLSRGIEVQYFRDNSQSLRRLFQ